MGDFTNSPELSILMDGVSASSAPMKCAVTVNNALNVNEEGFKATYRAGLTAQTFFSTSAAVMLELVGSATKTIRIKKISIWAQAGTKFYAELTLLRCTAASAGTPNVVSIGKHDKNDGAATAVLNNYTAAAAAGTGNAVIGAQSLSTLVPSATGAMFQTVWNFCTNQDKPIILRGTGDVLEVFNNTTGLGTATYGFEIEWEEDAS